MNALLHHETAEKKKAWNELRTILDSIDEGVISTDIGALVTRMNPVAEKMTGWPEAEAAGKPLLEVFQPG